MTLLDDDEYFDKCIGILKKQIAAGYKPALLLAVYQCALMRKPLPEWLCQAFVQTYESAAAFEVETWDTAFGPARKKGAQLSARKDYARLRYPVALRVALRAPGQSIDTGLFERIGSELGIGKTKASDIYYQRGGKELHEMIEPLLPWLRKINSGQK
jgi:hypothetical protein